jgi:hypothetical protein
MCEYRMDMDKRPKDSSQGPMKLSSLACLFYNFTCNIYLDSGLMNCVGMHFSTLNRNACTKYH